MSTGVSVFTHRRDVRSAWHVVPRRYLSQAAIDAGVDVEINGFGSVRVSAPRGKAFLSELSPPPIEMFFFGVRDPKMPPLVDIGG